MDTTKLICESAPNDENSKGSILNCARMNKCHTRIRYDGLLSQTEKVVSCHQCKNSSQIPFVAVKAGSPFAGIEGLKRYNVNQTNAQPYNKLAGGYSNFCMEPINTNFNIAAQNWTFPTNCAIGALNVDQIPDSSSSTQTTLNLVDATK